MHSRPRVVFTVHVPVAMRSMLRHAPRLALAPRVALGPRLARAPQLALAPPLARRFAHGGQRPSSSRALSSSAPGRKALPTIEQIRAFSAGDLEQARLDLSNALDMIPPFNESTEARRGELCRLLATTHLRLGNPLDAETLLDDARDIEDRHVAMKGALVDGGAALRETRFLLGVCYEKSGRSDLADREFSYVLSADDGHWRARFHLALLKVSQAEYGEAEELLTRVLEDSPGHATAADLLSKLVERRDAEANKLKLPEGEVDSNGKPLADQKPVR